MRGALGHTRAAIGSVGGWIGASAYRKFLASTLGVAALLTTLMAFSGYAVARRVIRESIVTALEARAELAASQIELTVGGVMNGARALARNGIVTHSLVDPQGRDLYLVPLLADFAATAPAPVHLAVVDFRGETIGCSRHHRESNFLGAPWIPAVAERGETRVVVLHDADGPRILFAQPVIFPGTGRPEGALVAEIPLAPIARDFARRSPDQVFDLVEADAPAPPTGDAAVESPRLAVERTLALGDAGDLRLRVAVPHDVAFRGLHRFGWVTLLGAAFTFLLVLLLIRLVAGHLTRGVRVLSEAVVDAALTERLDVRVPATGEDEVAALGSAFNVLLARLQEASAARLAEQVERREGAERALRLAREAVEQAAEAIEVVGADGTVAFANGAAAALRALPREAAVGARWEALFGRAPEWWGELWPRLRARRSMELSLRVQRGVESIPVAASLVYFELDGAEHCIASLRDLRERLRAEATDRLASLGTLAAGVAHEINNPLAYVLGNLSYVRESIEGGRASPDYEEERRALLEAIHGAERVRDVVRSLRVYSHAGQGSAAPLDVAAELRAALKLAGNTIRHHARMVEEIGQVPPVLARTNELGQVFVNLLVNAGHAVAGATGREPVIRVRCATAPDGQALVEVADTGVGIPLEVQPRIFEPFFTTKPVGDGTGLGLSICHGIVTRLGGTIGFESTPGAGTCFRVLLPACGPVRAAVADEEPAAPTGRILVIDDDPAVTRALARMLGRSADVAVETGPEGALRRLAAGPAPDAILCDVMMPGLTGPAFHARLSGVDPGLARRVVFITGGAVTQAIAEAIAATGQPCVEKPPERAALARALETVRAAR